jgi:hypothetical protein
MQDAPLHLLHAALLVASMMLTWQVHVLRRPSEGPSAAKPAKAPGKP